MFHQNLNICYFKVVYNIPIISSIVLESLVKLPFFLLLLYFLYFCFLWKIWLEVTNLICLLQQKTLGLVVVLYYMFTFYITDFLSWLIPFSHKIYVFSEIFQFLRSFFQSLFLCLYVYRFLFKHDFSWNSHIFRCFILISIKMKVYFNFIRLALWLL